MKSIKQSIVRVVTYNKRKRTVTLGGKYSAKWVLEGDIKRCFDNIGHDWLLNNIPMDKSINIAIRVISPILILALTFWAGTSVKSVM